MKLEGVMLTWRRNPPMAVNMREVYEQEIWSARNIFWAMLRNHGESINDVSLCTLLLECDSAQLGSGTRGSCNKETSIFGQPFNKLVWLLENELWKAKFKTIVNILQRGVEMSD